MVLPAISGIELSGRTFAGSRCSPEWKYWVAWLASRSVMMTSPHGGGSVADTSSASNDTWIVPP